MQKRIFNPIAARIGEKFYQVFVKAELSDYGRLSISGVEGPYRNGNCAGSCCQIDKILENYVVHVNYELNEGWTEKMFRELLEIWKNWHLNDMHAGCSHQIELGWEDDGYDLHPSEACPTCGYKFGSAWNKVDVPETITQVLFALPETTVKPAWC